jgi:hypothetical protein
MTEFLHNVVANREYIQRDMDMVNQWTTVIHADPWANAQDVVQPSSDDSEQRY